MPRSYFATSRPGVLTARMSCHLQRACSPWRTCWCGTCCRPAWRRYGRHRPGRHGKLPMAAALVVVAAVVIIAMFLRAAAGKALHHEFAPPRRRRRRRADRRGRQHGDREGVRRHLPRASPLRCHRRRGDGRPPAQPALPGAAAHRARSRNGRPDHRPARLGAAPVAAGTRDARAMSSWSAPSASPCCTPRAILPSPWSMSPSTSRASPRPCRTCWCRTSCGPPGRQDAGTRRQQRRVREREFRLSRLPAAVQSH